ncbi:MAG: division/cell wall cluster transcriptional repressor MraZ [Smithellaceae bacterium]|nr:division/cell wall cluster transcriptional repressor MraZ [Smithellaceae bacterium]
MSTFRRQFNHTIDDKGRIIFPAKFRDIFAKEHNNMMVMTTWGGYIMVFPYDEWQIIEEKVSRQSIIDKNVRAFQRFFISPAVDCTLDSQGRVLIPPTLREYAGLDKDIIIAGMLKTIEIWSKDRFQSDLSETGNNPDALSNHMAALGL